MPVTFLRSTAFVRPRYWAAALAVGGAALLSGCAYDDGYYGGYDYGYDRTVVYDRYGYPPPARVEYRTTAPSSRHVWVNGDWRWSGSRYQWVPGRWESSGHHVAPPPRPRPPNVRPEPPRPPQVRPDRPRPPDQARPDRPRPPQAQPPRPRPEQSRPDRSDRQPPAHLDKRLPWDHRPEG